jgi:hypothetical protein
MLATLAELERPLMHDGRPGGLQNRLRVLETRASRARILLRVVAVPGCFGSLAAIETNTLVALPQPLFQVFPVDDPEDQDHLVGVIDLIHESVVTDAHPQERIFAALDCLD